MFKVINEENFLTYIFQKDTIEEISYMVYGMKSGSGGNGVVLHLATKDGLREIHKSLRAMVIDGNWMIGRQNEEGEVKGLKGFLDSIYEILHNDLSNNKKLRYLLFAEEDNDWLKPQVLWGMTEDIAKGDKNKTALKKTRTQLLKWLDEDKQIWEFKPSPSEEMSQSPKPDEMKYGFMNYLIEARRHAQSKVTDAGQIEFAPYLAYALDRYWAKHTPKLIKKCDRVLISSAVTLEEEVTEKYEIRSTDNPEAAEFILYFRAPKHPYGVEKCYKAEINIIIQGGQTNVGKHEKINSIVSQLKEARKYFDKRVNDVYDALSKYFHDHGMTICSYGEVNFKDKEDLEEWLGNLKSPVPEKAVQMLGRWISKDVNERFDGSDDRDVRELLAQKLQEFATGSISATKVEVQSRLTKTSYKNQFKRPDKRANKTETIQYTRKKKKEPWKFKLHLRRNHIVFIIIPIIVAPAVFFNTWKFYIEHDRGHIKSAVHKIQVAENEIKKDKKISENPRDENDKRQETSKKYPDDTYIGEVLNNKRNGYGTMKYANGDKYTGNWKDDKRSGYGIMTFPDAGKYFVKFDNDEVIEQVRLRPSFYEEMPNDTDVLSKAMKYKEQGTLDNEVEKED